MPVSTTTPAAARRTAPARSGLEKKAKAAVDRSVVVKPAAKAAAKPALRPAAKAAPPAKPATAAKAKKPPAKAVAAVKSPVPAGKKAAAKPVTVKKSVAAKEPAKKPAAKKPAAKKPAAKPVAVKKPAAKKPAAKPVAVKKPVVKPVAAKVPAAPKKPAAKRPVAAKEPAAAKKPATKPAPAKKTAAALRKEPKPPAPKPVPPPKPAPSPFAVGDKVVYPHHGAAVIARKEKLPFQGQRTDYFVLEVATDQLILKVPVHKAVDQGVRPVISRTVARRVLATFKLPPEEAGANWSRWYKLLTEKINSGDIFQVAEVVRDLTFAQQTKGISPALKRMLSKARLILASELRFALDVSEEEAMRRLDKSLPKVEVPEEF